MENVFIFVFALLKNAVTFTGYPKKFTQNCQAQPQLNSTQFQFRLRLALVPSDPATHHPGLKILHYTTLWQFKTDSKTTLRLSQHHL